MTSEDAEITRPMAGFDSLMWGLESQPRMRSWIVGVLVLSASPDEQRLRRRLAELAQEVPRLRSSALSSPRPLAARRWLEHAGLDIDSIVSRTSAADVPGGLDTLIAETADQPYEEGSPVWSVRVVEDLTDGRAALLVRMHHSITDGAGAMIMAGLFFDADAAGKRLMEHAPGVHTSSPEQAAEMPAKPGLPVPSPRPPTRARLVAQSSREDLATVARLGGRWGAAALAAAATVAAHPVSTVRDVGSYGASLARLMTPAGTPKSPLMTDHQSRSVVRRLQYPIADLKGAAHRHGGRLNDVYVAGVLLGLRRYHVRSGVDPQQLSALRVYVPVNTRPMQDSQAGGNQFTPLRVELSLNHESVADMVAAVRERLADGRAEPALGASAAVTEVMGRMPSAVAGRLVSGMFYGLDACVTNVPGPVVPLWCAGQPVEALYALAPRSGSALCACLLSYDGNAYVLVNADAGAVADSDLLSTCLAEGMEQVLAGPS